MYLKDCKICTSSTILFGTKKILNKYDISYFKCNKCGFIQTEKPYWLSEAYASPINLADTGLLARNNHAAKIVLCIIYFFFDKSKKFLDVAGGYGVFTRLMRDFGLNFYWNDPYTKNLFANNFEGSLKENYELVTTFESFEHFENPVMELEKMLKVSKNIFFSTELQPINIGLSSDWFYWGFEHGQHIAFHTHRSLNILAEKNGLYLSSYNNYHLISENKINSFLYKIIIKLASKGLYKLIAKTQNSKTMEDSINITKKISNF